MPLSRLENFLVNTDGNILYVNPSDLDATDSFDNKGNSLTRPFATIQRALLEAARFAYQIGENNDKYDKTTILLYPGTHYIDNRPGYYIKDNSGTVAWYDNQGNSQTNPPIELTINSVVDLNNSDNILHKFNSVDGGVVVPKGTSIVGLDLRKTKVRPLYVPDPTKNNIDAADYVARSAIFRVTGGCYFWQFSIFDSDRGVYYNPANFGLKANPALSHHKLTVFEYADGINPKDLTSLTDLQMYYYKVMNAYGDDTGNRKITNYPGSTDFQPNNPEYKIVGDLRTTNLEIKKATANGSLATVETTVAHGLTIDDTVRITGISSGWYNGGKIVTATGPVGAGVAATTFSYQLPATPTSLSEQPSAAQVIVETDNVTGASPYVFNCSLRSTYGMCGLHADGDKATGFKSMVVAQFTGIGLQKDDNAFLIYNKSSGDYKDSNATAATNLPLYVNQDAVYKPDYSNYHIKASNSAFIQAVSVFAIGFSDHFLSESGSDQSITNSNSNFGAKSLISKGFRKVAFPRDDTGYVTHIVPPKDIQEEESNVVWTLLDIAKTRAEIATNQSSRIYLLGATDESNPPSNISSGYKIGARKGDRVYLTWTNRNNVTATHSSPILMQPAENGVNSSTGTGQDNTPSESAEKVYAVDSIDTANNILDFGTGINHTFVNGESVTIYSDTGEMPDGLENETLYYVIASSSIGATKIKLAKSLNKVASNTAVEIENTNGGRISVISRVTDKLPGDSGHPVQWDSSSNNWFFYSTNGTSDNEIVMQLANNQDNTDDITANNSATYVRRKSETRDLKDRIYKLRYVIPKEYTGAKIAKAPAKNYVLQESSTNIFDDADGTLDSLLKNRNTRVISGISTATSTDLTATVTTEDVHRLSVGDRVWVRGVTSSLYTDSNAKDGYNGYFYVKSTPTTKTFTVTIPKRAGDFTNNTNDRSTANLVAKLPIFSRNEYDTSYTIEDVETVQEYITDQQDGIYYLTTLIGNVSPNVAQFVDRKYKQNIENLYPTVDVDNLDVDPHQSISYANKTPLGRVDVNDSLNSITKEGVVEYLKDNRVGYAVTGAEGQNNGTATLYSAVNHNLNSIVTLGAISGTNSGYGDTTRYNVPLINEAGGKGVSQGATAKVTSSGGAVTAIEIMDGGSAYVTTGAGSTLAITGGNSNNAVVTVSAIDQVVGNVVQVTGVGTDTNRTNSAYNGLYKIASVPTENTITYDTGDTNPGVYTSFPQKGMFFALDEAISISSIAGIAGTDKVGIATVVATSHHGLSVGNKVKIVGVTGSSASTYNQDFIVQGIIPGSNQASTQFTIKTTAPNLPVAQAAAVGSQIYKYGISATGESSSLETEKISGRLLNLSTSIQTKLKSAVAKPTSGNIDNFGIDIDSSVGILVGDFLQIDNEIVRVKKVVDGDTVNVFRGVLGTKPETHLIDSKVKKIKVIPSEVRRFSSIRASGHTFEYLGYGPGNYSTALPQKQTKQITAAAELLAISTEEKGGVVFYSGMNDRGEFFSGERVQAKENYLGADISDLSAVFDDVYIRNTLRVGGGPNKLLPSEFRGPVNFTNKITSSAKDGIEAIKLLLKGNINQPPSFQVGEDGNPSLIVEESTQNVGIKKASPAYELDVNGTVRANKYQNFALEDLPTPANSDGGDVQANTHNTFARNRFLKVNNLGDSYELVDAHEVDSFALRSFGISNDPTVYIGTGTTVSSKAVITGINTSNFYVGEKVKLFGVTKTGNTDAAIPCVRCTAATVGDTSISPIKTYNYWVAQYKLADGRVGIASAVNNGLGINHQDIGNLNGTNFNALTLARNEDHGLLIYRQIQNGASGVSTTRTQARLIAILGSKEIADGGGGTANIEWKDYGTFSKTNWAKKGDLNEFLPSDFTGDNAIWDNTNKVAAEGSVNVGHQIHFPNIPSNNGLPTQLTLRDSVMGPSEDVNTGNPEGGRRRGWSIDEVVAVGVESITLSQQYDYNGTVGFGTNNAVKVVHDSTAGFRKAVTSVQASGSNYLSIPSGTYYTNELLIPSNFTLEGRGKNSIIKKQFFGNDAKDGYGPSTSIFTDATTGGVDIPVTGNFVGIGTTMASATVEPKDVTISNITIDGNNHNNIIYSDSNYMLYCRYAKSSLIKDVELRNSSGDGLYLDGSTRVSVENSTIVDGCLQDNIAFKPLVSTGSTSTRVNDSLFENYPGSVDVSGSTVVSTGGNIIRNCGAGLDAYATGKITTTNNILLGPSDEWLPSPDIYDSDWNSINLNVSITEDQSDFYGPEMLYVEDGVPKDLKNIPLITAGIGTLINVNQAGLQPSLTPHFVDFEIPTVASDGNQIDMEHGYIQLKLSSSTITEKLTVNGDGLIGISSHLGYEVVGTEFLDKPVGYTTYVGIATGKWGTQVYDSNAGTANTCYWVHLNDVNQFNGISVNDIVQLKDHSANPPLTSYKFIVEEKNKFAGIGTMRLAPIKVLSNDNAAFPVYSVVANSGNTSRPADSAGTYEVSNTTTSGSGTGAEFSVSVNVAGEATVIITSCGTGYVIGDTITITNAKLGGVAGGSNLVLTLKYTIAVTSGATDASRTAGTYAVTTITTSGSGTGAEFSVSVDSGGNATLTITSYGSGYATGDTITIAGSQIGGGANLVLKVDPNSDNVVTTFNEPTNILTNNNTGLANGPKGGYISIKKTFVIAKGRVGVS